MFLPKHGFNVLHSPCRLYSYKYLLNLSVQSAVTSLSRNFLPAKCSQRPLFTEDGLTSYYVLIRGITKMAMWQCDLCTLSPIKLFSDLSQHQTSVFPLRVSRSLTMTQASHEEVPAQLRCGFAPVTGITMDHQHTEVLQHGTGKSSELKED